MRVTKALKSEMAKAVLAAGIAGATPAFAQDADTAENIIQPQQNEITASESIDWYNTDIPPEAFWGMLALALLGTGYLAGYKRQEGALTRGVAVAVAFGAVANPETVNNLYRTLPTIFPVFVDESPSVGDRAPLVEDAFKKLETDLAGLGPVTIRRIEFGGADDNNFTSGTKLAATMQSALSAIPKNQIGNAFIISDGVLYDQSHFLDVPDIAAPVHALIAGHEEEQDFYITLEEAPRIGIVGEEQEFFFRVVDGDNAENDGLRAEVTFSYDGEEVTSRTFSMNTSQSIKLSELAPEGLQIGTNVLEMEITDIQGASVPELDRDGDGQPDEVTMLNNRITTSIEGIASEINVLLLTGAPHTGTRLWRDLLLTDPNINLTHAGYLRPPAKEDATPLRDMATTPLPIDEIFGQHLDNFDIIVADNYTYNGILPFDILSGLSDYVENGGRLMISGADAFTAPNSLSRTILGGIMPLTPADSTLDYSFIPQITEDGARHPLGRHLIRAGGDPANWGPWYSIAPSDMRTDATIIMSDSRGNPLLALDEIGAGRVAMLASDQNAVWASGHMGGGPAHALYRSTLGWLSENPVYAEENLVLKNKDGHITVELQTMNDPEAVIITTPSGEDIKVMPEETEPGLYTARIPADEQGAYRARRESNAASTALAGSDLENRFELETVISETEILRPLTDQTGGETARIMNVDGQLVMPPIIRAGEDPEDGSFAMPVEMSEKREPVGTQRDPVIPPWAFALVFATLMIGSFRTKEIKGLLGGKKNNAEAEKPAEPKPDM